MKKMLILSLFAVVAFVGQAWAACNTGQCCYWVNPDGDECWPYGPNEDNKTEADCRNTSGIPQSNCNPPSIQYCDWGTGGCYAISNPSGPNDDHPDMTNLEACQAYGSVVSSCGSGGGSSSPSGGGGDGTRGHCTQNGSKLYCGYEGSDPGCYKIQNEYPDVEVTGGCAANPNAKGCEPCDEKIAACEKDGMTFTGVNETPLNASPWGKGENCKTLGGTQVGGKVDCGNNYCKWDTGCEKVTPDPDGEYGAASANCQEAIEGCERDGQLFSSLSACNASSSIKRLSFAANNNIVKAIRNGVSVQLMSNAKIQVYDLKGNLARSLELSQGSYNVELSNMPRGIYIVKVSGLSWKQTVTVPVK